MSKRKIIRIDEERCDGCGLCVPSCAEGALAIIEGKARLISETHCDGLGACLGECPQGAITIEERDAADFDNAAVSERLHKQGSLQAEPLPISPLTASSHFPSCPGSRSHSLTRSATAASLTEPADLPKDQSYLGNWPVQIHLAPIKAPYFRNARLLIAADCVPFAIADFHRRFLDGRTLLVGCPKLDDTDTYLRKLTAIITENEILSIEIAYMEVPCCSGLVNLLRQALANANKSIPLTLYKIGIRGSQLNSEII